MELPPRYSVSLYQLPSTRPWRGCAPFSPSQCVFFAQHIVARSGMYAWGGTCPLFHLRRFILRMPSPVQHVWAGSIELLRRCLGRMRAEGPTCFSARGIAGYGVCVFGIRPTGAAETQSVCFFCSFRARGLTHICLLPRATALG